MPKLSSIYSGPCYCPHCGCDLGVLNGLSLQDELGPCTQCGANLYVYQMLQKPLSLDTINRILADQSRYQRFLQNLPYDKIVFRTQLALVSDYLTACILGEA